MIRQDRLANRIEQLGQIGKQDNGGVTRLALSEEYKEAAELVTSWMQEAGMTVTLDAAGNLIGRKEADRNDSGALPVVIGSHIDSVVNGGMFDGTIGVIGGIEVVQHLTEENVKLMRPIEVIAFCEEEGSRFQSGLFGSRALVGLYTPEDLEQTDRNGISRKEALISFGVNPHQMEENCIRRQGDMEVYLEMHIEQGPILEAMNRPVGIVTGIAGPVWAEVVIEGEAGHAGTLPMKMRHDAFLGASEIALSVEEVCVSYEGPVGTVGKVQVLPGGSNIVPGKVVMSVDVRDVHVPRRDEVMAKIREFSTQIGLKRGLNVQLQEKMNVGPVQCSETVVRLMREEAQDLGLDCPEMTSGAGHDAQAIAKIADVGMIFVRSARGISHNPEEFSTPEDIAAGTTLLSRVALRYLSK